MSRNVPNRRAICSFPAPDAASFQHGSAGLCRASGLIQWKRGQLGAMGGSSNLRIPVAALCGLVLGVAAGGCGTTSLPATLGSAPSSTHAEPPVEIYSRIARSALICWFGAQGALKKSHIFHADVAPEATGGGAEIILHERDDAAENPRSYRAYKITVTPAAGGSEVVAQNLRMPSDVGRQMDADVIRWANGKPECGSPVQLQRPESSQIATGTVGRAAEKKKAR